MEDLAFIAVVIAIGLAVILAVPLLIALMAQTLANMATDNSIKERPGGFPVHFRISELRYAVLHHTEVPVPHFDMLFETECGSPLMTWRSANWPITVPTVIERIADHRREYLEYEGKVSNDRGEVRRVAGGTFYFEVASENLYRIRIVEGACLSIRREDQTLFWLADPEAKRMAMAAGAV
jgi:hypothetical protein